MTQRSIRNSNEVFQLTSYHDSLDHNTRRFKYYIGRLERTNVIGVLPKETVSGSDLNELKTSTRLVNSNYQDSLIKLDAAVDLLVKDTTKRIPSTAITQLGSAKKATDVVMEELPKSETAASHVANENLKVYQLVDGKLSELEEQAFGRFDLFHKKTNFEIKNTTSNFSFGLVDWYVFEKEGGTFLCRPRQGKEDGDL